MRILTSQEHELKNSVKQALAKLLREEEFKWYQRAKTKKIMEGDNNTKYYHMIANGKHRKTKIFQLDLEEGVIKGDEELRKYITKFYKNLFGAPERNNFSMFEDQKDDIPQVTVTENEMLTREFSEEVKIAIFQMEHNKAPGPDGFPGKFYQVFWDVIKDDLTAVFRDFHGGNLSLESLNFGIITLLPKNKEARKIQQYIPICLLNVSFKVFTKVMTNRVSLVAQNVIKPSQTAFLKGRNIMEGAIILLETLHEMHRKKLDGVILKLVSKRHMIR
uniref:Retrotransposon protein, putative, unclassified n=1 Tax=Oryza sativa subsp. japonica TaxID=39947 RepID=Q2R3N6_ORYSJ|nr:retrotransposon protein, putative, unclassified [Oryza sativa Japonica Group]